MFSAVKAAEFKITPPMMIEITAAIESIFTRSPNGYNFSLAAGQDRPYRPGP